MKQTNFKKIEKKWQEKWEKSKIFQVNEKSKKKKYYVLEMYPYPSGSGLHMGHAFNYTIGDIYARFKRMSGFNVLYPMGFDALGLPAENAAIKEGKHPKKYTENAIKNFIAQQKSLGLSYDWSRMMKTCEPEYYKWNQFFFLKFLEKGLVYRKKAPVNWCPKCNTVLANEQVHNGKCWRHKDTEVQTKHFEQWFIKTTKYADELLKEIKNLQWPEKIKIMQKNWIGKSFGTEIIFKINNKSWPIFTTRPDTLYGVTFMVISAQHPKLMELVTKKQKPEIEKLLKKTNSVSEKEIEELEKEGAFTGSYAEHPLTKEKIPIYAGNFVVADYSSGIVMAVPAHDQRDFEFAKKYNIPIKQVIKGKNSNIKQKAYTEEGTLINSEKFNNLNSKKAIEKITQYLASKKLGRKSIQYKLKDWLISRQRYWGTPIPIVYCNKCGIQPVPEAQLPIKLPEKVRFGKGNPLTTNKNFVNVKCPKCKAKAKRETDTMDTFFDSSWYFLRYTDSKNNKQPFNKNKAKYWMPVDQYIGGAEHACMHLIYARFFTKALKDLNFINTNEPFIKLFNQGMVCGPDSSIMSKSRGNIINPLDIINKYSADILKLYLISTASPDKDFIWSDKAIQGSLKFIIRIIKYFQNLKPKTSSPKLESKINQTIKELSPDIENFRYNLAIIKLRDLFNIIEQEKTISKKHAEDFLRLLHPFCPHITEERWQKLKNKSFISLETWPKPDEKKINKKFEQQEQAINKLKQDINNIKKITGKQTAKVYVYVLPNELQLYKDVANIKVFAVNDKNKYDPENKSKKVKPGRVGIYLE